MDCEHARASVVEINALIRRVRRLEAPFAPPTDRDGPSLIEVLEQRRRRVAEANGETYVPMPHEDVSGMSIVEILRSRFKHPPAE